MPVKTAVFESNAHLLFPPSSDVNSERTIARDMEHDEDIRKYLLAQLQKPAPCEAAVIQVSPLILSEGLTIRGYTMIADASDADVCVLRSRISTDLSVVIISSKTVPYAFRIDAGKHACVYSASRRLLNITSMLKFHLFTLTDEHDGLQSTRYHGIYSAHDHQIQLSRQGWHYLTPATQTAAVELRCAQHDGDDAQTIRDAFNRGTSGLSLFILEYKGYNSSFWSNLLRSNAGKEVTPLKAAADSTESPSAALLEEYPRGMLRRRTC